MMSAPTSPDEGRGLIVTIGDRSCEVPPGEAFEFGREDGPGQITDADTTVSRVHGVIANNGDGWEVTSLGSYVGFLIHDTESGATLEVPAGAGPLGVPFQSVVIVVPARSRYVLTVDAPHLAPPETMPEMPATAEVPIGAVAATAQVVPESACFDRSGAPLRWFQVLVALCEPRLIVGKGPVAMPSDSEIRARLGMGASSFDRAFARARTELGFEPYTHLVRLAMMNTALHQGIVRPEHLTLLDRPKT